jgi:hypothetical protein
MRLWLRSAALVIASGMILASPGIAQAPDGTRVYTRIANWQIARPNWEAYTADLKKNTLPVLEKLLADGVITEYGLVSNAVHTPEGYTHSTWYCSRTLAGLEQTLAALLAANEKLPAAERRRGDTEFAGTKHSDMVASSRIVGGRTTKLTSGYLHLAIDQIQPGKGQAYDERYEKLIRPVLELLFKSGAVTSFGIDTEYIHTADPTLRTRWYVVPNGDGLDKVADANRAVVQERSAAEREKVAQASREILAQAGHRDELWQITAYASKY